MAQVYPGRLFMKTPHSLKTLGQLLAMIFYTSCLLAQPTISSFSPSSGPAGTIVTITGTSFNLHPDSNIVYFGGAKATVSAATTTTLTVTVPASATYDPISVVNLSTQLIGYSYKSFDLTFPGGATATTVINGSQHPAVNFPVGYGASTTEIADIDGDGRPDILVNTGDVVEIFRNTSIPGSINSTSFAAPVQIGVVSGGAWNIVVRDLDGDGKPDLLVGSNNNTFKAEILRNTSTPGHISFGGGQLYPFGGGPIEAADIDGDGKLDLITASGGGVGIWFNTTPTGGAISFANPVNYGLDANVADMMISDVDGDGKPDIVTANNGSNSVSILRNTARPGIINDSSMATYVLLPLQAAANHITIRDLDGDNKPDIIVSADSGIAILKNLATPGTLTTASFAPEVDIHTGADITAVVAADLDGDGKPDIVTPNAFYYGKSTVSILKNITAPGSITTASFATRVDLHDDPLPYGAAIADLDGDGRPELIVTDLEAEIVSVIQPVINTQPPVITSFTPDSATTGFTVTIRGHNLSGASAVSFGSIPATSFLTLSDTVITAVISSGASGNISVSTSLGTGTFAGFHFITAPAITGFTPTSAGRGDTVVITGSQFTEADTLTFGGMAASWFSVVNDNTIKAVIGGNGASGAVTVKTPFGTDSLAGFTYIPYPLITFFNPLSGRTGDSIAIHGKYLSSASAVTFGGTAAASFRIVSDTLISAIIGSGASGSITVTTPYGSATLNGFTYIYPAPGFTGFSPASGPAGTTVTITGSGFDPVAANNTVYFGTVKGYVSQSTGSTLTVTVPAGATYQPLTVTSHQKTVLSYTPFLLTFAGGGSIQTSSFAAPATFNFGTTYGLALADADGDGKLDMATNVGNRMMIVRNTSTAGQVAFGTPFIQSATNLPAGPMLPTDIDGDGRQDFAVGLGGDAVPLVSLLNTSTPGNISLAAGIQSGAESLGNSYIATGDFNRDGLPDVVAVSDYANLMNVLTNTTVNSNISFNASANYSVGYRPNESIVNDFDGDGKPDVIIEGYYTSTIYIFKNTSTSPTISFAAGTSITQGGGMVNMVAADIDGDGKPDLVISTAAQELVLYRNTSSPGTISFAAPVNIALTANSSYVTVGDLDGDGKPDLVTAEPSVDSLMIFHNNSSPGTFAFGPAVDLPTANSPGMIAIGDMNGDGKPDIVVNANAQMAVYLNQINIASAPTLTAFTPASAAQGAVITLKGTHLTGTTAVTFGGAAATAYTVVSDTVITATLAGGASGSVSVTTPNGTASKDSFTYTYPAPAITGFTPTSAAIGGTVTITGTNLTGVTTVTFGGVPATSFYVENPSTIIAIVGAAASGSIAVISTAGTDSLAGFGFIPPPPVVTSFTPANVSQGTVVTITGTGFTAATGVSFGGAPAASFTVVSPTSITAVVANGSTGNVAVTNAEGSSSIGWVTYTPIVPTITSFTPVSGPAGTVVTIVGTNLGTATAVEFGNTPASSFTVVSADTIQATVGAGSTGNVTVTTAYGTPAKASFTLMPPASTLTSFTPASATTGQTVTITGTHLTGATSVSFGGTAASSWSVYSDNAITAIVGSGATGNIVVGTASGPDTLTGFTFEPYIVTPSITTVYPWSGQPGDTVQIYGSGFTGTTSVTFGGVSTPFVVRGDALLVATIGNGASGNIVVTNSAGTAQTGPWRFIPPTPIITSFSPQSGPAGTLITIRGANLSTTWEALVGQSLGEFGLLNLTVVSDSVVTGNVNSLSNSGPVTIWASGGNVSFGEFTILPAGTPQISGISPVSGGAGTVDTITGLNFTGITAVSFGGVAASSFTVVSPTMITAVVGQGASGSVEISGTAGSNSFAGFTYTGATPPPHAPVLYSFSPTTAAHGDTVTINGIDLDSVISISFGGTPAQSFNILNDSSIIAIVGTGATGKLIVNSPQGADTLYGFIFDTTATTPPDSTTTPPPPVQHILSLSSFTPAHAGQGDTVTIRGTYLDSTSFVSFGGTPAQSFRILNDSVIVAIVGSGASGKVLVNSPQGIDSLNGFTFDTTGTSPPPDSTTTPPPPSFQLTQFTGVASGNQALLQWSALHEQHIATYIIEHGNDTIHFSPVGAVAAEEKDSASYSFTDTAQRTGVNFYRLAIIDVAFDSSFSQTIAVQLAGVPWTLTVYPNPVAGGSFTVSVPSILTPSYFQLADMSGNIVQSLQVPAGTLQQKIMTTGLQNGVYKIIWSNGNNSSFQTVLILK